MIDGSESGFSLHEPFDAAMADYGEFERLYIADLLNDRILVYRLGTSVTPTPTPTAPTPTPSPPPEPTDTPTPTPSPTAIPPLDSDGDGFSDDYEINNGSDPYDPQNGPLDALDMEGDGQITIHDARVLYLNRIGLISAIPPAELDSDGDGFSDDYERAAGTDPNDPESTPLDRLDMDGDGQITIKDALIFYRNRMGLITVVPLPPK